MSHTEGYHYIDSVSKRLTMLTEANRSLAEIESLNDPLPRLMDLAKEVTAAEASLLFLHKSESRLLEIVSIKRSRLLEQRIEQERLRAELEAAAKIQQLFWPKMPELGEGSHVWGFSEPAASVGGDLYDVIPMPDASWLVYVADVAGKGLPAALIMAALSAKISSIAPLHNEVGKLLANVNKEMYELMSEEGFFATMVLSKYWPKTGREQTARAGHPYPLWVINHGLRKLPKIDGIPIGAEFGTEYEKREFVISPGEAILFITDGVTEAENEESELFGDDRLIDYFEVANGPPGQKLFWKE
jgi:sigma-B regulation protein RsbU (phosphoserine phosphatase)